jgi:hypothetical protein
MRRSARLMGIGSPVSERGSIHRYAVKIQGEQSFMT